MPTIKNILRFPFDYPAARRAVGNPMWSNTANSNRHSEESSESLLNQATEPSAEAGRTLVLRLTTSGMLIDAGRHLLSIAIGCERAGFEIILQCPRWLLSAIGAKRYGQSFLQHPTLRWEPTNQRDNQSHADAYWTDDSSIAVQSPPKSGNIPWRQLCIGRTTPTDAEAMPYPRHPHVEKQCGPVSRLRQTQRRVRIFFGGNNKASYGRQDFAIFGGLMNRPSVLQVASQFRDRGVVLRDVEIAPVPSSQWLQTISEADFFLCPPGSSQPFCHHFSEALSVGTIPILQYGRLMHEDLLGTNAALAFDDAKGLKRAINLALSMSPADIAKYRVAACEFYDRHFDHQTFMTKQLNARHSNRRIAMPFHHHDLYCTQRSAAA